MNELEQAIADANAHARASQRLDDWREVDRLQRRRREGHTTPGERTPSEDWGVAVGTREGAPSAGTIEEDDVARKKKTKATHRARERKPDEPQRDRWEGEVTLAGVSFSSETAAVGWKIKASLLTDKTARAVFVGARLSARLTVAAGQTAMFEEDGVPGDIESVGDVGRVSVGPEDYSGRLSFKRDTIDVDTLAALAGKTLTLVVERVGDVGEQDAEDADEGVFADAAASENAKAVHAGAS